MKLIVPIAGQSSRFKTDRPKWMLTHPNGRFMVTEAVSGLNLKDFEKIFFVGLKDHEDKFQYSQGLKEELDDLGISAMAEIVLLDHPTSCQPETVAKVIELENLKGYIFVKDSDNFFEAEIKPINQVCYFSLNDVSLINAKNKSYLNLDSNGNILNIVEKNVIGPNFCVGGYGFEDAQAFLNEYNTLKSKISKELYISDIIFSFLLNRQIFLGNNVDNYEDWGTLEDWNRYKKSFVTLLVDLDGTLVENSSKHFPPYVGNTKPLAKNIELLKKLKETGRVNIIITTSREDKFRDITLEQLKRENIPFDYILMGLFHSKRIVINDYSSSNSYKTCDAINIKRDSDELENLLMELLSI